jgi:hypothetical protein
LASAQRKIRVSRAHIPPNRQRRKPIPTAIQTPGDYIQAKRYEKGLHPYAVTSYGSQGKTVDYVLFSDSTVKPATNAQ